MVEKYILIASNLPELTFERISFDPLNMNDYSQEFVVLAIDEDEAISKFQKSRVYSQFCDKHKSPHVFIKGEKDTVYRRINETL